MYVMENQNDLQHYKHNYINTGDISLTYIKEEIQSRIWLNLKRDKNIPYKTLQKLWKSDKK